MDTYSYRAFKTASGSLYEIQCVDGQWQARRAADPGDTNPADPTPRVARNGKGVWTDLAVEPSIEVGQPVLLIWPDDVPLLEGSPAGSLRSTITSPVVIIC